MYLTAEYCVRQRDNIDYNMNIIIVYISLYSECVICYYIRYGLISSHVNLTRNGLTM